MKLTSTNRSIDLHDPITNAHLEAQSASTTSLSSRRTPLRAGSGRGGPRGPTRSRACGASHRFLFPDNKGKDPEPKASQGRPAVAARAARPRRPGHREMAGAAVSEKKAQNQLLKRCASPTWWSWRGGRTRSHPEHGRETPQRRWYFVSRRGRVGRRQVRKTQQNLL